MTRYLLFAILVGLPLTIFVWLPRSATELGIAIAFGLLTSIAMYAVWYIVMSILRYQYVSAANESMFFVQLRATMRTLLILLVVVIYLPLAQAIADMITFESRDSQAQSKLRPLHLTFAILFLVVYVIGIPVGLFWQLNQRHWASKEISKSLEGSDSPSTANNKAQEERELIGMEGDSNFMGEGQQADEMVR